MSKQKNQADLSETFADYLDQIEIPEELNAIVDSAIQRTKPLKERNMNMKKFAKHTIAASFIGLMGFVGSVNLSPTFASSISDLPLLGSLVKVVNLRQFEYQASTYNATLEAPVIEGLEDEALQKSLNTKYLEENKKLYEAFEKDVAKMEQFDSPGHLGVDSGFEIKTNTEDILSIARYVVNTVGSSSTTMTYDTIDKKNEILITLPSLFIDEEYISIISENIKTQMKERMKQDENLVYWIEGDEGALEGFDRINVHQPFYITAEGKLIISFDKYEVSPGFMGIQEFEIPTEVIEPLLVSSLYIH
ncbi:anti-sigma factor [Sporanaerobium hydrogeniformans]|uniref:Anti-sigma factor n=1 Tax=Sporanaerobium hydrogeniformans TaxID=3072179 RepID=A0AC61DAZ9_9FIRM|nr:RsiV family protein [Sporanaerobium hydrogeniformans]PHV70409.1 anti-sigma factor [Sporanaerobium hydrogeniformans]